MLLIRILSVTAIVLTAAGGVRLATARDGDSPESHAVPAPARVTCAGARRDVPGGRDPWGGCFPGPRSTGVPAGTRLSAYTGPCRITEAGTVISGKFVNCAELEIFARRVHISDSRINGSVWVDSPGQGGSFTISDSTIEAGPITGGQGLTAIGKSHFVATRVETFGGIRGIWCEYDCTVRDSWIHGQATDPSGVAHESGVRMGSGSARAGQRFIHNAIVCDAPDVPPDAGCSADLTGYGDFATIQHNKLERNLFGASTGGTCAYGGSTPDKPYPGGNHNVFVDNVFQRGSGHCGRWFAIVDLNAGRRGNRWVDNRWSTGSTMRADG